MKKRHSSSNGLGIWRWLYELTVSDAFADSPACHSERLPILNSTFRMVRPAVVTSAITSIAQAYIQKRILHWCPQPSA
jgi:hypothetical protein